MPRFRYQHVLVPVGASLPPRTLREETILADEVVITPAGVLSFYAYAGKGADGLVDETLPETLLLALAPGVWRRVEVDARLTEAELAGVAIDPVEVRVTRREAPFTDAEVAALFRWQNDPRVHAFTDDEGRPLVPTTAGWEVQGREGVIVQDWCHAFMLDPHPSHFRREPPR